MDKELQGAINDLLARNVLIVAGEVNGEMVKHVYRSLVILEARGSPDIEARIFTSGGSVGAGLDIYDAIRRYAGKKTGIVYAYARSMGAVILQACDERVCLRHASILIHHVNAQSVSLDAIEDKRRFAKLRSGMWADQKALYAILAKRTKKTEKQIKATCQKEMDMSAAEALRFGLIDRIEDGRPDIKS